MNRSNILGKENITKLLWRFSLPAITGMVVNAVYNIVDSIFVGNGVGEIGLAAVTIAFPIMLVLMAFGMMIGIGAGSLVSIRMGQQRRDEAEKILGNALTLVIVIALGLTAGMVLFLDQILIALGAEADVLPYARDFTKIILYGCVFMFVGFGMNNIVRAEGNPKMAMSTMLISAVINTILNPIFIFWLNLGISGSALATVTAQFISAAWVLLYFLSKRSVLKLHLSNMILDRRVAMEIITNGLSPFFMQMAASVVMLLFNFSLLRYGGDIAVAAMGIVNRVTMLVLMPIFGISQGVQPIIGYNYGAKKYPRVIDALKKAILASTALATVGFLFVQVFDTVIVSMFNRNPELVEIGSIALRIMFLMLPIIGFQIISAGYFQAVGKPGQATFLSMSRQVIMLIPLVLILPRFFGIYGVWYAGPIADLGASILTGVYLFIELRKLNAVRQT